MVSTSGAPRGVPLGEAEKSSLELSTHKIRHMRFGGALLGIRQCSCDQGSKRSRQWQGGGVMTPYTTPHTSLQGVGQHTVLGPICWLGISQAGFSSPGRGRCLMLDVSGVPTGPERVWSGSKSGSGRRHRLTESVEFAVFNLHLPACPNLPLAGRRFWISRASTVSNAQYLGRLNWPSAWVDRAQLWERPPASPNRVS